MIEGKDIECPYCGANTFDSISNHSYHGQTNGEFNYECFVCNKEFEIKFEIKTFIEYVVTDEENKWRIKD